MTTLVADIGGTNARFALCRPGARPRAVALRTCADFPTLEAAAAANIRLTVVFPAPAGPSMVIRMGLVGFII